MDKSPEAFRTISEVAEALETPAHVLRFWETRFPQIRPVKRAGGRRYYRPSDVALLAGIKRLLHEDGMTIRGVQKILREQGIRHVSGLSYEEPSIEEMALGAALLDLAPEPIEAEEVTPRQATEDTITALHAALAPPEAEPGPLFEEPEAEPAQPAPASDAAEAEAGEVEAAEPDPLFEEPEPDPAQPAPLFEDAAETEAAEPDPLFEEPDLPPPAPAFDDAAETEVAAPEAATPALEGPEVLPETAEPQTGGYAGVEEDDAVDGEIFAEGDDPQDDPAADAGPADPGPDDEDEGDTEEAPAKPSDGDRPALIDPSEPPSLTDVSALTPPLAEAPLPAAEAAPEAALSQDAGEEADAAPWQDDALPPLRSAPADDAGAAPPDRPADRAAAQPELWDDTLPPDQLLDAAGDPLAGAGIAAEPGDPPPDSPTRIDTKEAASSSEEAPPDREGAEDSPSAEERDAAEAMILAALAEELPATAEEPQIEADEEPGPPNLFAAEDRSEPDLTLIEAEEAAPAPLILAFPVPPAQAPHPEDLPRATLAARLRALPRGSLAERQPELRALAARIAALRDRLGAPPDTR